MLACLRLANIVHGEGAGFPWKLYHFCHCRSGPALPLFYVRRTVKERERQPHSLPQHQTLRNLLWKYFHPSLPAKVTRPYPHKSFGGWISNGPPIHEGFFVGGDLAQGPYTLGATNRGFAPASPQTQSPYVLPPRDRGLGNSAVP